MPSHPPAVARVLRQVTQTVRDHHMFAPGDTVLVAVSGGPDSMCLLESLVRLRRLFKITLGVVHVDHRLRENSAADARYVRAAAERHELPYHLHEARTAPAKGESMEDWAHRLRVRAYASLREETGADKVAVAHTRDDQAEQVLIGLLRGEPGRVSGLAPVSGGWIVRPLLDVTRADVVAMDRALRLRPRSDPSNADTRHLRNAVRRQIIPAITRATGRDPRDTIARVAAQLREDQRDLWVDATGVGERIITLDTNELTVDAVALSVLPSALAGRIVVIALTRARHEPNEEHVRALLDLASGRPGRGIDLGPGLRVTRDRGYIHIPFRKARTEPE